MVFGTRPEAIKMAPLFYSLKANQKLFDVKICVTGQHRQMLDQVLNIFDISPDFDMNIMKSGQDLSDITSIILLKIRDVFKSFSPDILLVHGDTTSAFASSLAAFYAGVKVGHVEAGLRTYNLQSPYPEEFNRQIISKLSNWHFAPTKTSRENLIKEGIDEDLISITGNTVIDSLHWILEKLRTDILKRSNVESYLDSKLDFDWMNSKYVLITGHRRENFGDGFLSICSAIKTLSKKYPDNHFIYPVHLNPNVQQPVKKILFGLGNVHLIDPLEYEFFVYLLSHSYIVLTDSGGIQEEAPSIGKPVLVMRETTERPEAVESGTVKLVGKKERDIIDAVSQLLDDEKKHHSMSCSVNPYGDGHACEKITDILKKI